MSLTVHAVIHGQDYDAHQVTHLFTTRRAARHAHDHLVKHARPGEYVDLMEMPVHDSYREWRAGGDDMIDR